MKAKPSIRQFFVALVAGGALLAAVPALAGDRDHRRYDDHDRYEKRGDHRYDDRSGHRYDKRDHDRYDRHKYDRRDDYRGHYKSGYRHDHRGKSTVVYRYEPGVVVHVPPIVFRVN